MMKNNSILYFEYLEIVASFAEVYEKNLETQSLSA
jgi:hypothetical protein